MPRLFRTKTLRADRAANGRNRYSLLQALPSRSVTRLRIERLETRAMLSVSGDFNGDGFDDLAIGARGEIANGQAYAGGVNVIYGAADKLKFNGNQLWTLDSPGINGVPHIGDGFGKQLAVGDFNGDGFDDLAVGTPDFKVAGKISAGAVNIIYGSAGGLTAKDDQQLTLDSSGVDGVPRDYTNFGGALAAGDFNNDGRDELAIGAAGEHVDGLESAGAVHILFGKSNGLSTAGDQLWSENSSGINGVARESNSFGSALTSGDFNGDGRDDLAVGVYGKGTAMLGSVGAVNVIYSRSGGLSATGDQQWQQSVDGLLGTQQLAERFGSSLAAGDFDNDGFDDLAASAPYATVNGQGNAGELNVLYGSAQKLTASRQQLFTAETLGLTAGNDHRFGIALTTGDFDGNGRDELAVGITGFDLGSESNCGLVAILRSSSLGLTNTMPVFFTQDTANIAETAEEGDFFGYKLSTGDFDGNGRDDLVIAAPYEDLSDRINAGGVHVLYGGISGPMTLGSQFFTQDTVGILGSIQANDEFGGGLA